MADALPELTPFERRFKGRCVSCGFLAKHADAGKGPTSGYFETEMYERRTGVVWAHTPDGFLGPIETYPVCFRGKFVLTDDIKKLLLKDPGMGVDKAAARRFLAKQDCDGWYPYTSGFDPRWHYEELRMLRLEENRRNWETTLETDRKVFEKELHSDSQKTQRAMRNIAGWQLLMAVVAIGLSTAVSLFVIRCTTSDVNLRGAVPVIVVTQTPTFTVEPSPTLSPQSTPDRASTPPQPAP